MKKVIDKAESRGRALYDWLDSHHTFSFDTYYCGLLFFDKKKYKQHYKINF